MSEIENALAWADHKKASIVPAHTLAAEVRRLRAELAASEKARLEAENVKRIMENELDTLRQINLRYEELRQAIRDIKI
jgi:hypothetical protein